MALPNLPYWFHAGRSTVPIKGPVYVLTEDGKVAENLAETVILQPRRKFFASSQAVSHLVRRGLVKRLPQPEEPKVEEAEAKDEGEPAVVPAPKSDPEPSAGPSSSAPAEGASDAAQPSDEVAAKEAPGEEEAGNTSVPEEKEQASTSRKRRSSPRQS